MKMRMLGCGLAAMIGIAAASPALAAGCHKEPNFDAWLQGVKRDAAAAGISAAAIDAGLGAVRFDQAIVNKDRAQGVFAQTFLQFSDRMVEGYRLKQAPGKIAKLKSTFQRIEKEFGVPAPVIVAFWGLETDFGANIGDGPTLISLATLAYDCRRPDLFREQLLSALKIIDRGDLTTQTMRGPWAGELGQFQFLPDHYFNYGVDFDGDGRVDLIRSAPDALASAANYVRALGWKAGQPWLEEVRVPQNLPWDQADLAIKLPRAQWARMGVMRAGGGQLPADQLPASLLLPMGRNGPAFLAYPNFDVFTEWNNSLVYATSAAYLATRVTGAGPFNRGQGKAIPVLSMAQVVELQRLLNARGHHVGRVDGIVGAATRQAIRTEQMRLGMPADSYPTVELVAALRAGR